MIVHTEVKPFSRDRKYSEFADWRHVAGRRCYLHLRNFFFQYLSMSSYEG